MESNTWCPRLTAWIILSGSAVHVKGFGSALCSTTKRLMAACKSTTDEDAVLQSPLGERGEEALDGVEPECRSWGEVEGPAGMPEEPLADLRTRADIDDLCHRGGGPVGCLFWRVGLGQRHDALGDVGPQR